MYLDEIDDVWTNHPDSTTATARERELRTILGMTGDFMGQGQMTRKVVAVTATQSTNVWLSEVLGVRPNLIIASEEKLRARGYAGPDELIPWRKFLDPSCHNKSDLYCIDSPEFEEYAREFDMETRPYPFMLVTLSSRVGADSGCYDVARTLAGHFPHWFIVTKAAEGVRHFTSEVGHGQLLLGAFCDIVNRVDLQPAGPRTKIVAVSFALRGSSVRSDLRVVTHQVSALTSGMNSSAFYQNAGRGGGKTIEIRRRHGYLGISHLTFRHDAAIVKQLDSMTATAAANVPGMATAEYAHDHRPVFGEKRPLMRKALKFSNKRIRFADPAPRVIATESDTSDPNYDPAAASTSSSACPPTMRLGARELLRAKIIEYRARGLTFVGSRRQMAALIGRADIFRKDCLDSLIAENLVIASENGTYSFAV